MEDFAPMEGERARTRPRRGLRARGSGLEPARGRACIDICTNFLYLENFGSEL